MLFDKTGNYQLTLIFSAIAAAIAVLCSLFIVEKRHYPGGQPSRRQEAV
jgi:hypothetical protein